MRWYFLEPAADELKEAISHYEQEKPGLGSKFAREVQQSIQRILKFPKAWSQLAPNIRRRRTDKFPYGIVYSLEDDDATVVIVAVMHLRRRPDYWKDRIQ
jgi:plasmid stabilization system protein ParE